MTLPRAKRREIWFTSDLHFGHSNAIGHSNRPFKDVEEMNEAYIKTWNEQVKPQDIVYCLGDIFWNTMPKTRIREIMKTLNGEKHMVIGNHDKLTVLQCLRLGFTSACYEMVIKIGGEYVKLSHYPHRPTLIHKIKRILKGDFHILKHYKKRPKRDGKRLLFGHTHGKYKMRGLDIHIGIDGNNHKLVNISQIESLIARNPK